MEKGNWSRAPVPKDEIGKVMVTGYKTDIFKGIPGLDEFCNPYAIFCLRDNWYYSTISGKRDENIEGLFTALYPQYADIFGEVAMSYKPVIIYDSPNEPNPKTSPHDEYTVITLSADRTTLWSKLIFQLSHEMTHYAFLSLKPDAAMERHNWGINFSRWNEEIICEAMSLYMLNYMAENWDVCSLSEENPGYRTAISEYLQDEYNEGKNLPLKHDTVMYTRDEFKDLSDVSDEKEERYNHGAERNYCYKLFQRYGNDVIGGILRMYRYYFADDVIDFKAWASAISQYASFVKELSLIQPEITDIT